jgi:hypothetical protein
MLPAHDNKIADASETNTAGSRLLRGSHEKILLGDGPREGSCERAFVVNLTASVVSANLVIVQLPTKTRRTSLCWRFKLAELRAIDHAKSAERTDLNAG